MRHFDEINHRVAHDGETPLGRIVVSGMITSRDGDPNPEPALGEPCRQTLTAWSGAILPPPRVVDSYTLVYLLEGSGLYADANGTSRSLRAGDALLLFPEQPHSFGPGAGQAWSAFYTQFRGPVFDLWRQVGMLEPARPVLHVEPVGFWLARLKEAVVAAWDAAPSMRSIEISKFLSLITELLAADLSEGAAPDSRNWLAYARFLLEADLSATLDLESLARRTGVSYECFRKRFQHQTGVSPAHYRMARRIQVASDLLRCTSMTNRQVAESVGFSDEYAFYKRFKRVVGKTPSAFRHDPE